MNLRRGLPLILACSAGIVADAGLARSSDAALKDAESDHGKATLNLEAARGSLPDLSTWSAEDKAGQLLMVGFRSVEQVEKIRPAGVVLFAWNMPSVEKTRELTRQLLQLSQTELKSPLFIATDHEGGKVLRLRKGLTNFPDAAAVGATKDPETAFQVGKAMGHELTALGINMNLAPVMDLGNARSFLENRVWGEDSGPVGQMTTAYIRGLEAARVLAVAKHFPGHGGSVANSHFRLPRINKTLSQLWKEDLEPFRKAFTEGVEAVMTAHVEYPKIDRGPASLSERFVNTILREELGFRGLVITDDLEMGGVIPRSGTPVEELAMRALKAGTDLVLVVWSTASQVKIRDRIVKALKSGEVSEAWIDEKIKRIWQIRSMYSSGPSADFENPFWKENLRRPESVQLAASIPHRALSWLAGDSHVILGGFAQTWDKSWLVYLPEGSAVDSWKAFRPNDEIRIQKKRADIHDTEELGRSLDKALKDERPLVVVTGPRASSSEDVFSIVREKLGHRGIDRDEKGPVLWVHQGARPVQFRIDPNEVKIGMLSLHSASVASLMALTEYLRDGRKANDDKRLPASNGWN